MPGPGAFQPSLTDRGRRRRGRTRGRGAGAEQSKHLVLKAAHPSPLSAHAGFYGCKHFALANEYLTAHHLKPIDWNSVNGPE